MLGSSSSFSALSTGRSLSGGFAGDSSTSELRGDEGADVDLKCVCGGVCGFSLSASCSGAGSVGADRSAECVELEEETARDSSGDDIAAIDTAGFSSTGLVLLSTSSGKQVTKSVPQEQNLSTNMLFNFYSTVQLWINTQTTLQGQFLCKSFF